MAFRTASGPAVRIGVFMLRYLMRTGRVALYPIRLVIRRPRTTFAVAGFFLAASATFGVWYVRHQWQAAREALVADRPDEARSRLAICLAIWPQDAEVRVLAARAARLSGDLTAAEDHLNRCLKLRGGATEAVQLEFLLLRVQTGDLDEVERPLIETVERKHPDSPHILETLAKAYMRRLRYRPAYACLSRWIELRPDAAKPYLLRGWVLERLNHPKPAMQDYLKALESDPDLIPVRLRVAEMLLEDNLASEALPHLEQLHRQAPDLPQVQARLGMCRFLQGQPAEARRLMEAAVIHLPDDPVLLIHLARLDLGEGRYTEAEQRLRRVLQSDPSDTEAWFNLFSVLRLLDRPNESAAALKEYERNKVLVDRSNKLLKDVADTPTGGPDDYSELGETLIQIGKDQHGLYWLERALERDPGHQRSHRALAAYYEKKGDATNAASHRRQVR